MHRSSRQKISKETELDNTMEPMDLTDIYRTFYLSAEEYTFFSSAHRTFFRINHKLGQKKSTDLTRSKSLQVSFPATME